MAGPPLPLLLPPGSRFPGSRFPCIFSGFDPEKDPPGAWKGGGALGSFSPEGTGAEPRGQGRP